MIISKLQSGNNTQPIAFERIDMLGQTSDPGNTHAIATTDTSTARKNRKFPAIFY
jgi:hypothetical protein